MSSSADAVALLDRDPDLGSGLPEDVFSEARRHAVARVGVKADPINPRLVYHALNQRLPENITVDEANGIMETLIRRDPADGAIVEDSMRALAAELFTNAGHPHTGEKIKEKLEDLLPGR